MDKLKLGLPLTNRAAQGREMSEGPEEDSGAGDGFQGRYSHCTGGYVLPVFFKQTVIRMQEVTIIAFSGSSITLFGCQIKSCLASLFLILSEDLRRALLVTKV